MPTPLKRATTKPAAHRTTTTTAAKTKAKAAVAKTKAAAQKRADAFAKGHPKKKTVAQTEAAAAVKHVHVYPADPKTPPPLTGKVSIENGQTYLDTKAGKFQVINTNDGADSLHFFAGSDIQAFVGREVTVRGWPAEGWIPGQTGASLAIEEWSPGKSPDFVAGRVMVSGDDVLINVRSDKQVKVDDPKLKAALKAYDNLGIVLPGDVEKKGAQWHFAGKPTDYYVLAGFSGMYGGNTEQRNGDKVTFPMQLAHGKSLDAEVPAAHWDRGDRQQRHYFYGHIDGQKFISKGFTPSAGPWLTQSGINSGPDAAFRSAVEKVAAKETAKAGTGFAL